ncbi:hypothetical protein BAE44_0008105 [Dichanthelium oligosanthes]|uniref:Disease resistance R13L4/SHOC-2-like LRR domain-containing protein n=1 Tax=Dichanthelium oligosanthes TaxID=888268 RepID=A0A1E5W0F5_9POAL|nr:hypothetical protein BAE44_0008105 [Dichanthelium oligosanthes]
MSLLQSFQVLRVLSLEGCTLIGDTACHLKNLSGLVHLRYLGLHRTRLGELPMEVGDLKFLQTLDLRDNKIEALPHSVTLLRQLKCLLTDGVVQELPAGMGNLTSLEELHLPAWINASLVPNLSHLDVTVKSVETRDLDQLGSLPELRSLVLFISDKPFHAVIAAGAFPKLRYCHFSRLLGTYQPGAMPCLNLVMFNFNVRNLKDANFGLKGLDRLTYLPSLENVLATIYCWDAKTEEVQEAEAAAVRHAINIHPKQLSYSFFFLNESGRSSAHQLRGKSLV